LSDLQYLKDHVPSLAIFFIKVPLVSLVHISKPAPKANPLDQVRQVLRRRSADKGNKRNANSFELLQQLLDLGLVSALPSSGGISRQNSMCSDESNPYSVECELVENFDSFPNLVHFAAQVLQRHLVRAVSLLNVVHTRCLQNFIMVAFDMARDMMITPKRLEFARSKEIELYASLMDIALKKQDEIKVIILDTISSMRDDLMLKAENYSFQGVV
jgi:receptor-interacting serine/threonine-protein kinase 5